jgi:2-polyprenyl-6-methoxyphenol hydroxylase-like FAD-dependent oxidoreductase
MSKIAILGAGHGGCACAVDLIMNGFDITLCSAYSPDHIKPIIEKDGLEFCGKLGEGFVRILDSIKQRIDIDMGYIFTILQPSRENHSRRDSFSSAHF